MAKFKNPWSHKNSPWYNEEKERWFSPGKFSQSNTDENQKNKKVYEKLSALIKEVAVQERQRNHDNIKGGSTDQFYEEETSIRVDFNEIQKFLKGVLQQRSFWYENITIELGKNRLKVGVLFKPAEIYRRNIVYYVRYPKNQPIHPNTMGTINIDGYGLYLMNETGTWPTATLFFESQSDLKIFTDFLIEPL